jgi:DNA-binding transcriptional ArsR family regulator
MSHKSRSPRRSRVAVNRSATQRQLRAPVFAALGDEMRLALVAKLCAGEPHSISQLTEGSRLTRQAVTKHLRVLERVGIVRSVRCGRETRFQFDPEPIAGMKEYLDSVSAQWDRALGRLKSFVED